MTSPCYICGKGMEELRLDGRDMKPRPCTTCEDIINETVGGGGDPDEVITWGEFALSLMDNAEGFELVSSETSVGDSSG